MRVVPVVVTVVFLIIIGIAFVSGKILSTKPFSTPQLLSPTPSSLVSPLPSNFQTPDSSSSARIDDMNTPSAVVTAFSDDFLRASSPMSDPQSAPKAFDLLTDRAKTEIQQKYGDSNSGSLAKFIGLQNTPNDGITLGKTIVNANQAQVPLTWNFTDRNLTKTFYLYKEQGIWQIDMIK